MITESLILTGALLTALPAINTEIKTRARILSLVLNGIQNQGAYNLPVTSDVIALRKEQIQNSKASILAREPHALLGMSTGLFRAGGSRISPDSGLPVTMAFSDLKTHMIVFGRTRSGKTAGLGKSLVIQMTKEGKVSCLIMDAKGALPYELKMTLGDLLLLIDEKNAKIAIYENLDSTEISDIYVSKLERGENAMWIDLGYEASVHILNLINYHIQFAKATNANTKYKWNVASHASAITDANRGMESDLISSLQFVKFQKTHEKELSELQEKLDFARFQMNKISEDESILDKAYKNNEIEYDDFQLAKQECIEKQSECAKEVSAKYKLVQDLVSQYESLANTWHAGLDDTLIEQANEAVQWFVARDQDKEMLTKILTGPSSWVGKLRLNKKFKNWTNATESSVLINGEWVAFTFDDMFKKAMTVGININKNKDGEVGITLLNLIQSQFFKLTKLRADRDWKELQEKECLVVIDEAQEILNQDHQDILAVAAGHGVHIVVMTQHIEGLKQKLGPDLAKSILGNLNNAICYESTIETMQYMQEKIGKGYIPRRIGNNDRIDYQDCTKRMLAHPALNPDNEYYKEMYPYLRSSLGFQNAGITQDNVKGFVKKFFKNPFSTDLSEYAQRAISTSVSYEQDFLFNDALMAKMNDSFYAVAVLNIGGKKRTDVIRTLPVDNKGMYFTQQDKDNLDFYIAVKKYYNGELNRKEYDARVAGDNFYFEKLDYVEDFPIAEGNKVSYYDTEMQINS